MSQRLRAGSSFKNSLSANLLEPGKAKALLNPKPNAVLTKDKLLDEDDALTMAASLTGKQLGAGSSSTASSTEFLKSARAPGAVVPEDETQLEGSASRFQAATGGQAVFVEGSSSTRTSQFSGEKGADEKDSMSSGARQALKLLKYGGAEVTKGILKNVPKEILRARKAKPPALAPGHLHASNLSFADLEARIPRVRCSGFLSIGQQIRVRNSKEAGADTASWVYGELMKKQLEREQSIIRAATKMIEERTLYQKAQEKFSEKAAASWIVCRAVVAGMVFFLLTMLRCCGGCGCCRRSRTEMDDEDGSFLQRLGSTIRNKSGGLDDGEPPPPIGGVALGNGLAPFARAPDPAYGLGGKLPSEDFSLLSLPPGIADITKGRLVQVRVNAAIPRPAVRAMTRPKMIEELLEDPTSSTNAAAMTRAITLGSAYFSSSSSSTGSSTSSSRDLDTGWCARCRRRPRMFREVRDPDRPSFLGGISLGLVRNQVWYVAKEELGKIENPTPAPKGDMNAVWNEFLLVTRDRADHHSTEIPFTHFSHMSCTCTIIMLHTRTENVVSHTNM